MHLTQKPSSAECLQVDNGVRAFRASLDDGHALGVDISSTELLWLIARKGVADVRAPMHDEWRALVSGSSSVFFYTKEPWQLQLRGADKTHVMGFGISLTALHQLLSVDFDASKSKESSNVDYSKLTQIITLTPRHLQDIDKIFVQGIESRFAAMSRRGAFLSAFSTLLETLYGQHVAQCPFHIDFDTEQKLRRAHEILIANLHDMPDLVTLAREANLPKAVLKEGFEYLYGKPASQYYQDYKFEKSLAMLESGKYLIRDIAFAVGFQNPSHFISAFKLRYHTTPKQWIKNQRSTVPELI